MKSPRRLAWLVLVVGIGLLVAFPFRTFLLDNLVMPVALVAWLLWRVVLSVSQALYWGVVIVALAAVAAYRLAQAGAAVEGIAPPAPETLLKSLADWRTWLQVTSAESEVSDMLRRQLAQMLAAMYAAKEPQAAAQFIYYDGLQQGRLPLPASVYAFLFPDEARAAERSRKGRVQRWAERPRAWIRHWTGRDRAEFYQTMEETLAFMESLMEIAHGDNYFDPPTIEQVADLSARVVQEVEKAVIGKHYVLNQIMAAFLSSGGHILLEDYPGLAKTLIASSFATALGLEFSRIQFTPDLLPGDITGGYVFDSNQNQFRLRRGPLFANIVLADEINRASPKTQSALLEAMQEYQVTLEGDSLALPSPFIVIATQNPIEYEGTFPLPEAQLDRFMVKLAVGYPSAAEEAEILKRRTDRKHDQVDLQAVIDPATFLAMRAAVEEVYVDPDVRRYIVEMVAASRRHRQVAVGASPRGSLALLKLARAWAAVHARDFVIPDDVKEFTQPALVHRLILEPSLWGTARSENTIITEVVASIPVPVLQAAHE